MSRDIDNLDRLLQRGRRCLFLLFRCLWLVDELVRIVGDVLLLETLELFVVFEVAELVVPLALHLDLGFIVLRLHYLKVVLLLVGNFQTLVSFILEVELGKVVVLDVSIVMRLPKIEQHDHVIDGKFDHG